MSEHTLMRRIGATMKSQSGAGALVLLGFAALIFAEVAHLKIGGAANMGPGYFPATLGGILVLLAAMLLVDGWRRTGEAVDFGSLRAIGFLLGGIVSFALLLDIAGAAIAIVALVTLAALAENRRTIKEIAVLSVIVVALVWLVFVFALQLQLYMLPKGLAL